MGAVLYAVAQGLPLTLHLICPGSSTAMAPSRSVTGGVYGSEGSVTGSATESELVTKVGTTEFKLENGSATIRPPMGFVARKGKAGWFPVKNLTVSEDEITGELTVALLETSRFRIDRRTGEITTSGGYRGICSLATDTRKF